MNGGTLTPRDADKLFHCMSLAQRIKELKEEGHDIRNNWNNKKKEYAKYVMYGEGIRRCF
jgi:hypothetical protein